VLTPLKWLRTGTVEEALANIKEVIEGYLLVLNKKNSA
jgi:predicted RNase H-like HicB family nuclease